MTQIIFDLLFIECINEQKNDLIKTIVRKSVIIQFYIFDTQYINRI